MPIPKMPTELKIGTVAYTVVVDADEWIKIEHSRQRTGDFGYSEHLASIIYINPDSSPGQTRLTLWHEILHCLAESVMGSPTWDNLGETKEDRDEAVVRCWEHPTLAVLRDNPELVAWLMV